MQPTPQRLRAKHISNLYGVAISTVWNYAKQGLITPIKVTSGVTVFDRDEIEAFFSGEATKCKS